MRRYVFWKDKESPVSESGSCILSLLSFEEYEDDEDDERKMRAAGLDRLVEPVYKQQRTPTPDNLDVAMLVGAWTEKRKDEAALGAERRTRM